MDFSFVHAADLHLDTPYTGLAQLSPEAAEALRDASLDAFDALVRLTLDANAAFLLLAGDIYDGEERGLRAQFHFLNGLERLSEAGIPVFIVHGNHDPLDGWSAIHHWPEGVTIFGSDGVERIPVTRGDETLALVHGISYRQREVTENLALGFSRGAGPHLQIGLLHCNAGAHTDHGPYSPCSIDDLAATGLDYWALGHVHSRRILREGDPWIAYPGNTQGRSFASGELGAKGALVVNVDGGAVTGVNFEPLDSVRFLRIETDIAGHEDLAALQETLVRQAESLAETHEDRGLILRSSLTGRGALSHDLKRPGVLAGLLEVLRDAAEGISPLIWWESLRDTARSDLDLDQIRRRGDFSAELLARSGTLAADHEALRRFFETHCLGPEKSGVARWIDPPDDEELSALLLNAESLAIDLLEDEQ